MWVLYAINPAKLKGSLISPFQLSVQSCTSEVGQPRCINCVVPFFEWITIRQHGTLLRPRSLPPISKWPPIVDTPPPSLDGVLSSIPKLTLIYLSTPRLNFASLLNRVIPAQSWDMRDLLSRMLFKVMEILVGFLLYWKYSVSHFTALSLSNSPSPIFAWIWNISFLVQRSRS